MTRWRLAAGCSAVAAASCGVICASTGPASTGPARVIAGLTLLTAFACAVWLRFPAIVPAVGLTLVFLVLAGLALAAVHSLNTVPAALVTAVATLAVTCFFSTKRRLRIPRPRPLALVGVLAFAVAAVLAVRYAAVSATADENGASSLAVWAYPSVGQLHVGARQPAGHGAISVRIVVLRAGTTAAVWNNVYLAPDRTWTATVPGNGPIRVIVLHGGIVAASLPASP